MASWLELGGGRSDSDGDGYEDGYEVNHGADPLDADDFPAFNVPGLPPPAPWLLLAALTIVSRGAYPILANRASRSAP